MDEKDELLVKILARQANLSSRELSGITGIPVSTVHRRIKQLEAEGVILGYRALIDYERTREPISALLLIDLVEGSGKYHIPKSDVIAKLKKHEEIEDIVEVQAFNFDLIVKSRFHTLKELSAFIEELRSIEGIGELMSAIITEEISLRYDVARALR